MLPNDPFPNFEMLSITQLGELFGTSAQVMGLWLKEVGLRLPNGAPAPKAIDGGLARTFTPESGKPFWIWRKLSVVRILEAAEHRRAEASTEDNCGDATAATRSKPLDR